MALNNFFNLKYIFSIYMLSTIVLYLVPLPCSTNVNSSQRIILDMTTYSALNATFPDLAIALPINQSS